MLMTYAHSKQGEREANWEPLEHHLSAVGHRAEGFATWFGAGVMARAMGLLHDIGKCSAAYQAYIRRPANSGGPKGPDHSTAGAREACNIYGEGYGRILGFGIAGHHSGLMNGSGEEGRTLSTRLSKAVENYAGWQAHVAGLPDAATLKAAAPMLRANTIDKGFSAPFLTRMLFSSLVDADFLETETFYANGNSPRRGGCLQPTHLEQLRTFLARHRRADSEVNKLRSRILDHANAKAELEPGLFTLTVPTGGGKTLISLSFAMEHAARHGLRRIVYVIPFTSIIEQTAAIFRDDVGLADAVLEHHASFDWDQRRPRSDDEDGEGAGGLAKLRLDAENWDAPVVVTTAVQFFESLFAARTSQARKLHNLAQSVIVLDEAQSIPVHLLRPCMAAIEELARNYGASVILCTATQPALRIEDGALPLRTDKSADGLDIPEERELAPDPADLYRRLRRVAVAWRKAPVADEEIAARFAQAPQMLCVVNSRAHAQALFARLHAEGQQGAAHLTTLMCARHRREVLARLRHDLQQQRPVRLVSTSLIEAGVDISFPEVWRAAAGLFSVAQAAGRCNRSGELGALGEAFGKVVLFESADHATPRMIEAFYAPARTVLRRGLDDPLGLDAVRAYYEELYFRKGYAALDAGRLDGVVYSIVEMLRLGGRGQAWPFADVARAFRMIDDVMDPIIVRFDDAAEDAVHALYHAPVPPAGLSRLLQQYVVPVPARVRAEMIALGAVQCIRPEDYGDRFAVLENRALYDARIGLRLDDPVWRAAETNVF
ncbi:CRISPR-associated endonuclease Cas3'' [Novosphingobium sp. SG916]|uniref:CRISPR-associated endonuclease Cas3'' n=2 Tax=unclassified Novosphingobium TaxID=2644732 RepID=UPI0032B75AC6